MRQVVRAIVVRDNQLLVMHRNNQGKAYYNIIGGGIEPGESHEEALLREVDEETSIKIRNPRPVFTQMAGAHGLHHVYVCEYVSGEPHLRPDSREAALHAQGKNLYQPLWLDVKAFASVPFVSESLRQAILHGIAHGWPVRPVKITGS